jgi:hypothetical protein
MRRRRDGEGCQNRLVSSGFRANDLGWRSTPGWRKPVEQGDTNSAFFSKKFHRWESTEPQVVSLRSPRGARRGRASRVDRLDENRVYRGGHWGGDLDCWALGSRSHAGGIDRIRVLNGLCEPRPSGCFLLDSSKTSGSTTELSEIAGVSRMARPQRGPNRFTDEPVPANPTQRGIPHVWRSGNPERSSHRETRVVMSWT